MAKTLVTPEMAEKWLSSNADNQRQLKKARVEKYAKEMLDGMWLYNGESIVISESGRLLDGQHRLSAVIKAGIPVEMAVIDDVPDEQDGIDTFTTINSENRSNADVLYIEGIKERTAMVVKHIRLYEAFKAKKLAQRPSGLPFLNHEIVEVARQYDMEIVQETLDRAENLYNRCDLLSKEAWILMAAIERYCNPPKWTQFIEELGECTIGEEGPVAALIRRISVQDKAGNIVGKNPEFSKVKLVWIALFKAYTAYKNGEVIKNMRVNSRMPIEYPQECEYETEE